MWSPDDENPHNFRPGRWHLFPSMDYDALFWYDLQWNALNMNAKNMYEDEELVFTWNSISAKQRGKNTYIRSDPINLVVPENPL